MGKLQKRKGGNVPFAKGTTPILFTMDSYGEEWQLCLKVRCISEFIELLIACGSLSEQMKTCQLFRGTVRLIFSAEPNNNKYKLNDEDKYLIKGLLYIFLFPPFFSLRKSLEWIIDVTIRKTIESDIFLQKCLIEVF